MKLLSSKAVRIAMLAAVLIVIAAWYLMSGEAGAVKYVTKPVTRGAIVRSVTATGTVNPVITVQVGSYVSGPIVALYADFNSPVKQGQIIAKIDPQPFAVKVDQARAAVANAKAQLNKDTADLAYKRITYERNVKLGHDNVVSQDAVDSAFSGWKQAEAQVALDKAAIMQQEANLRDAEVNFNYTKIVSPVDGTVVSRNVDVGQTVAASFQTPTLFLIAKDLTRMQVDSNVSESDIGGVRMGERAMFTVDAFGDRQFEGVVGQVRQAPITVQNVVTYDVVVNVDNPELLLKPGMTANVTIVTAERDNVVRIPEQALRFRPRGVAVTPAGGVQQSGLAGRGSQVWIPDGAGVKQVALMTGIGDGTWAEMISGPLKPGDAVVIDETRMTGAKPASSSTLRFPH